MAQLLSNRAAVISYGLLIGWQVPPAIDQFTAGLWWWDVCAPGLLRHRNLQATRLFCQHPVSPDLEGLPNLGDLPHLVLSFDLVEHSWDQGWGSGIWARASCYVEHSWDQGWGSGIWARASCSVEHSWDQGWGGLGSGPGHVNCPVRSPPIT